MELTDTNPHVVLIAAGCSRRLSELTQKIPKSFLPIRGKKLIEYNLDILEARGFRQVTLVVGYLKECFFKEIGTRYKNLDIEYVVSEDFENTGHAWSLYLTRSLWEKAKKPVVLIHADVFYHPSILDKVVSSEHRDVLGVDDSYVERTGEELVVLGKNGIVRTLAKGVKKDDGAAGESVGINKWSPEFMERFFAYMEGFFAKKGGNHNWEPVLAEFIRERSAVVHYEPCGGLAWININRKDDYDLAQGKIYESVYGSPTSETQVRIINR